MKHREGRSVKGRNRAAYRAAKRILYVIAADML